jgi:uncharacterized coiled-coil DUF342 family protein
MISDMQSEVAHGRVVNQEIAKERDEAVRKAQQLGEERDEAVRKAQQLEEELHCALQEIEDLNKSKMLPDENLKREFRVWWMEGFNLEVSSQRFKTWIGGGTKFM